MRLPHLLIVATALLFLNTQCGEDFCSARFGTLQVDVAGSEGALSVGDTIWMSSSFDATLNARSTITEAGGNVVAYLFAADTVSGIAETARESFDFVVDDGRIRENRAGLEEPAGLYFSYACPAAQCRFRIGLIPREPGLFLINTSGLGYSITDIAPDCRPEDYMFYDTNMRPTPAFANNLIQLSGGFFNHQFSTVNRLYRIPATGRNNLLFSVD